MTTAARMSGRQCGRRWADMSKSTHAAQLVAAIRRSRRGMTYGDLQALRISTAPHKRLAESAHLYLRNHEELQRMPRKSDGLVMFRIVRCATRWTA